MTASLRHELIDKRIQAAFDDVKPLTRDDYLRLMEHRDKLTGEMVLKITPIKEGANVNVESAMAARNEEVKKSLVELNQIKVQPVYEIKL